MLFEFIYEMLIPYATKIEEGGFFPERRFLLLRAPRPFRDCLYIILRLPSWQWRLDICRDQYGWHQLYVGWRSDTDARGGFFAGWRSEASL